MKIRTDFVTNSSSSGFVCITVKMKNGKEHRLDCEYDSGYGGYLWNGGDFSAFKGCNSLIEVEIPATVTSIGEDAFEGCIFTI